ncbi:MAG: UvrB/UvrC motif-containing protein [Planctomycetota bacterium]
MSEAHSRKCERCGERDATVHITKIVDGEPVQRHFCENCYEEDYEAPSFSSSDILSQLIGALAPELERVESQRCPDCGINYLEFRQNLTFGCPTDYEVFSEPLDELLEGLHGATKHTGRVPRGTAQRRNRGPRLEMLRRELQAAVEEERFEEAARIRDEIAELENEGVTELD